MIVEVDSRGKCQSTFHPLDVVRWQMCTIDVSLMTHLDEVIDQYETRLRELLASVDQRMLVTRVELVGTTSLHAELQRRLSQLRASLRATTITHGLDRAWLEAVRIRTSFPQHENAAADFDGPMESLAQVVQELRQDPEIIATVERELQVLIKKLPPEVDCGGDTLPLSNPQWLDGLIDSASADIIGRLRQQEQSAS